MSAWIVYAVGFSQIIVLNFLAMPYCLRMTYDVYLGKNPQWVADNAFRRRYPLPRFSVWLSFLLGVAWLAYFGNKVAIDSAESMRLSTQLELMTWPMASFAALYVAHAVVECFRVRRKIPMPTRRTVSLERRTLKDLIDLRWIYCGYLFTALVLGAYIAALLNAQIDTHVFVKHTLLIAVAVFASTLTLIVGVRRKSQSLDNMWGPSYRKSEIIFGVACIYLVAVGGAFGVVQDVLAKPLLSILDGQVIFSVIFQVFMFYMGRHSWPKNTRPKNPNSPDMPLPAVQR